MFVRGLVVIVFVLISLVATGAAAQVPDPGITSQNALQPTEDQNPTASVDIDLSTATLDHGEFAVGPFAASVGLFDRVMVGSYSLPWLAGTLAGAISGESVGGTIPNAFAKAEVFRYDRLSASLSGGVFYGRLGDIDGNGLELRALAVPLRALVGIDWNPIHTTTFEFGGVYSGITGENLEHGDLVVGGLVLARSAHAGVLHRVRLSEGVSVWARARTLVDHAPVRASFSTPLNDSVDARVTARANAAELSTGHTGTLGVHLGAKSYGLTAGAGWGSWFVPGLYIPISEHLPFGEFNFYWRF